MFMQTDFKRLLRDLIEYASPSGYEDGIAERIIEELGRYTDDITRDELGNVIARIPANTNKTDASLHTPPRILLAAHMDEIGLIVSKIEDGGFLRFTQLGGFDPRTLIAQEVFVHGKSKLRGVIGSKPPHLTAADERDKAVPMEELFIDLGMPESFVREQVDVGDLVTIARQSIELLNDRIAGKSSDNRASIVSIFECLEELNRLTHEAEVYVVATVQEETTMVGAFTSTYGIRPDIGIAIDVTHASMPGVAKDLTAEFQSGPAVGLGPNIHKKVLQGFLDAAKRNRIPYQIKTYQGPTPTDARAIQITAEGIATGLLSIPLRYMHTSVEVIDYQDIRATGLLLAHFIAACDRSFVEGLSCYLND
jgi:tetrahedral aminopeptidase